jgi:hypothetical protein
MSSLTSFYQRSIFFLLLQGAVMITLYFSVYDSKVGSYLPTFPARSRGEALRMFETAANDKDHQFHKYASDYTLFELGSFDDLTGSLSSLEAKVSLGTALEYIKV